MAAGPQQFGFSNDEKNYLLAELIKSAAPPHNILLDVFNRLHTQPRLDDIPLPPGRSMNACRLALDEMRRASMYSPLSSTGTMSAPLSAPMPPLHRRTVLEASYSAGRALLPKTSGFQYAPSLNEPPLKRKRGRPTKAEQQARAAEAAGIAGEHSLGHPRFSTPMSASVPPSPIVEHRPSSTVSTSTRVPISTMITTPTAPKSASQSGSSSGKRRRRRRSEEQASLREHIGLSAPPKYPVYARLSDPDDTHARATSSRHPDEPIHSSVARLGVSESEQTAGASAGTASNSPRGPHLPLPTQPGR